MIKPFVLNDETIKNSHGFYLVNAGGRFERFDSNPVMLDNHNMDKLCGRWLNRRIEGNQLIADPEFDEGCDLGAERKGQVERGFLRGASLAICIISAELREEEVYVTEWEVFEASVTPVPSNSGATQLKLYDIGGREIKNGQIKSHIDDIVQLTVTQNQSTNTIMEKSTITLSTQALTILGLSATPTAEALSAAVVTLAADRDAYKAKHETALAKAANDLIELAIRDGKITADKKEAFVKLALADFDTTKSTLEGISTKQTLSGNIRPIGVATGIPAERKKWTLLHWLKEDPEELERIKQEEPDTYTQIKIIK